MDHPDPRGVPPVIEDPDVPKVRRIIRRPSTRRQTDMSRRTFGLDDGLAEIVSGRHGGDCRCRPGAGSRHFGGCRFLGPSPESEKTQEKQGTILLHSHFPSIETTLSTINLLYPLQG